MARCRVLIASLIVLALVLPASAGAVTLPSGFQETTAFSGLDQPMVVEFAADGRVFVGEKSGRVKVFDNLADTTPTLFADLRTKVHDYWDRGLEGMTLHPNFPAQPYVYVHYVHDAAIGGTAPRWGDTCPDPPGGTGDGCVVSGRVSRLTANGNVMTGSEQVLVEDWCMQYPSHAGGGMDFGADGYMYVTGGDGAAWHFNDYGQDGNPVNPCGDPPGGAGTALTPPTAEGGRLRAQDMRTTSDPAGLNGSLIRIDPTTGLGVSGNPFFSSSDLKARRIIAYGFRNPFRMTIRPGTSEAWVGDVGNARWEEFDRHTNPNGPAGNYGWPCYEGANKFGSFDSLNLNICENLYAQSGAVTAPYWAYDHNTAIVSGENCPNSGNALAGLAFYPTSGGSFPAAYAGALFFADNSRNCIWALRAGTNGLPDPNQRVIFAQDASYPVDLKVGPGGDLFYVDIGTGAIRRIRATGPANAAPNALAAADPPYGTLPLAVNFDATGSTDPNPSDTITFAWDFDGNGTTDSTAASPTHTYDSAGNFTATLTVRDPGGLSDTDTITIRAGNTPPVAVIDSPAPGLRWKVGDPIEFAGHATDDQQGDLAGTALSWSLVMRHCVTTNSCHSHAIEEYAVAAGSFNAPDHEYPSHLELTLTATDAGGLTDTETLRLDPQTVQLTLTSQPAGAAVAVNSESATAPLTHEVIARSRNSVGATTPQTIAGQNHVFESWSDGGDASHDVTAPDADATLTAQMKPVTTLTFTPQADARVQEANPSTNYPTGYLRTDGAANPDVESYLRFQLSGIGGQIVSAKLRLQDTDNATVDGPAAYGTSTSWTESGIKWSNRPARTSGPHDDRGAIAAGATAEWDVTPLVSGNGPVGIVLAATSADGANFAAREDPTSSRRPQLIVSFTPVVDAGPPSTPAGLTAQATGPTQASLSWTAADDDVGVTGYEVYRDGALIATLGNVTSYADTGLSPATTYSYVVCALDAAGNRSAPSHPANVITPASPAVTTLAFPAVADARVNEASASKNYGTSFLRTVGGSNPDEDSYLRFQPSGIAGQVTNARLRLYVDDASSDGPAAYATSSSWTETGITWSNRPARGSGPHDDKGAIALGTTLDWNVTPLVSGNGTVSFALGSTSTNGANFSSRENATSARRPQLVVTFGG